MNKRGLQKVYLGIVSGVILAVPATSFPQGVIVHVVNPENVILTSIEGFAPADLLISVEDVVQTHAPDNYNALYRFREPGTKKIRVVFNGIAVERDIHIQKREVKVEKFVIPRLEFDLEGFLIKQNSAADYTVSGDFDLFSLELNDPNGVVSERKEGTNTLFFASATGFARTQ